MAAWFRMIRRWISFPIGRMMRMKFRYFDKGGRQLTIEQLHSMRVLTPDMDHVFATVAERVEKNRNSEDLIENNHLE